MTNRTLTRDTRRLVRLRAIILDLDGVVADTEDLHRQAYNLTFEEAGLPVKWTYEDYRARLILSAGSKLQEIAPPEGVVDREAYHKHLYDRKREHYVDLLRKGDLLPRPGIIRLVDEAL